MFASYETTRKNTTAQWCDTDTLNNYKPSEPSQAPNYSVNDITYKFNSNGFRCDEFSIPSDFHILFAGDELTEGIGLPLEHTWPQFLLSKIKSMPEHLGKSIPFHSIALAGTGIDTAARLFIEHLDTLKPKILFLHTTSIYTREFCDELNGEKVQLWRRGLDPKNCSEFEKQCNVLFANQHYALFEYYRKLHALNIAAQLYNTTIYLIDETFRDSEVIPEMDECMQNTIRIHSSLNNPGDQESHNFKVMTRDSRPFGPQWQKRFADNVWSQINLANIK